MTDDGVSRQTQAASANPGLDTSIVEALARQLHARAQVADAKPGRAVSIIHAQIAAAAGAAEPVAPFRPRRHPSGSRLSVPLRVAREHVPALMPGLSSAEVPGVSLGGLAASGGPRLGNVTRDVGGRLFALDRGCLV